MKINQVKNSKIVKKNVLDKIMSFEMIANLINYYVLKLQ